MLVLLVGYLTTCFTFSQRSIFPASLTLEAACDGCSCCTPHLHSEQERFRGALVILLALVTAFYLSMFFIEVVFAIASIANAVVFFLLRLLFKVAALCGCGEREYDLYIYILQYFACVVHGKRERQRDRERKRERETERGERERERHTHTHTHTHCGSGLLVDRTQPRLQNSTEEKRCCGDECVSYSSGEHAWSSGGTCCSC